MDELHYYIIGTADESGELLSLVKQAMRSNRPIDPVDVLDEGGDVLYYLRRALAAVGWTLDDAEKWNARKLEMRRRFGKDKDDEAVALEEFATEIREAK